MQALCVALEEAAVPPHPVLYRLPHLPALLRELYAASSDFAAIAELPWEAATPDIPFQTGMPQTDLRDFALDPAFRGVAMIDFFLTRLGIEPATIAPYRRRNTWLARRIRPEPPVDRPNRGYVLLCPDASMALRSMPLEIVTAIRDWMAAHGGIPLRMQTRVTRLAALCGQVAGAALVVSTDTATVHLADAFSVPCLAFFTTHRPEWRVRDYPLCRAVHLPAPDLPPALEFSRGPADLAASRAAWFPEREDRDTLGWLHDALSRAVGDVKGTQCST